jgi:hypothetical protein
MSEDTTPVEDEEQNQVETTDEDGSSIPMSRRGALAALATTGIAGAGVGSASARASTLAGTLSKTSVASRSATVNSL